MDYRIQEVIKIMDYLEASAKRMPMAKLSKDAVSEGMRLSRNVCEQEEFVFATPWMKNLLVICGDIKQEQDPITGVWHTEKLRAGQESRAVDLVNEWVRACLAKFNGPKRDSYDEQLPVGDIHHYDTDCWLGWKPKIWDIQLGQAEERAKVFSQYTTKPDGPTTRDLTRLIRSDRAFQKAILNALEILPEVRASREVRAISDPFMSKGTGVSYPDYKNDRTKVKGKDITYGQYEIDLCTEALRLGRLAEFAYDNNVYTGYPRNQRGKGRALEAQSRRTNLVINLLNSQELEGWKRTPQLSTPFLPEDGIKANLIRMAEWLEEHPDYVGRNEDTTGWDRSVSSGWITLSGAIRYLRCNGEFSKKLCEIRHNCAKKAWFIDGPNSNVGIMYGRTPSGYDDTTLLNSSVHYILSDYALLSNDPTYSEKVIYPTQRFYKYIVGDDITAIMQRGESYMKAYRKTYHDLHFEIHSDEKSIFGVMFIQYRVFRDPDQGNKWVMAYNWPRVYRSMLSKETAKQLGVGGWTLSAWQQLGKLIEAPKYCAIPLNLICACDQYKLHLDTPVSEIKRMIQEEDEKRFSGSSQGDEWKKKRKLTTAERLSNNPTLPGVKTSDSGEVEIDWDYFESIQSRLRSLYDPDFLVKLGFENPDLSKVH